MTAPKAAPLDPVLILAAGRGDPAALALLARRARPVLEEHARRALGRRARHVDAEDVIEETVAEVEAFLAAGAPGDGAPGWARFDPARTRAVEGWLYGIVRNKVRRRLRDVRRRSAAGEACADRLEVWDHLAIERQLDAKRVLRLASALPPRERAALRLWLDEQSSRDIARRLRCASTHAADCLLARSKVRLRTLVLANPGPAPAAAA